MLSTKPLVEIDLGRGELLNLLWAALTLAVLGFVFVVWPADLRTWKWGLLIGAGVGAGAMTTIGYLYAAFKREDQ